MDVKITFLNGYINEENYVSQSPDFENHDYPSHVYKLKHALYGLKWLGIDLTSSCLTNDTLKGG